MKYASLALLLSTTPALAEITPLDLLESWELFSQQVGDELIIEQQEQVGNTLTLYGLEFAEDSDEPIEWVKLEGLDDGSVNITLSKSLERILSSSEVAGLSSSNVFSLIGLKVNASGEPDAILYRYSYDTMSIETIAKKPGLRMVNTFTLQDGTGEILHGPGGNITQNFNWIADWGQLDATYIVESEIDQANANYTYVAENVHTEIVAKVPNDIDENASENYRFDEVVQAVEFSTGVFDMSVTQGLESPEFTYSHDQGGLMMSFVDGMLDYGLRLEGANVALQGEGLDIQNFEVSFGLASIEASMPYLVSGIAQNYSMGFGLIELEMSDATWGQFDPTAALSRSPASFEMVMEGTTKVLVELFDNDATDQLDASPFAVQSVLLRKLSLEQDDFSLFGSGNVTLDPERLDPETGLPEAVGALDFSVNGALGLLDSIGRLGMVEPMMILGAKGSLGMFATPGEAPDQFSTRIEFIEGGGVSVNGQRVR